MTRATVWRYALMWCVPCVALVMVARQVYLSRCYGLTTWKGGGMGMFAAADELTNRYAKVFLLDANGDRNPLVQLSPDDFDVLNRALEFPTRERFLRAAKQLAHENWIPSFQPRPILKVNGNGDPIEATDKSFRQMVVSQLRPGERRKAPGLEVQFWKISYDPQTRHEHASLTESFVFAPAELFSPKERFRSPTAQNDS